VPFVSLGELAAPTWFWLDVSTLPYSVSRGGVACDVSGCVFAA
jgi:hypothetical protein